VSVPITEGTGTYTETVTVVGESPRQIRRSRRSKFSEATTFSSSDVALSSVAPLRPDAKSRLRGEYLSQPQFERGGARARPDLGLLYRADSSYAVTPRVMLQGGGEARRSAASRVDQGLRI